MFFAEYLVRIIPNNPNIPNDGTMNSDTDNRQDIDSQMTFQKAVRYHHSGQLQKALESYTEILNTNPNHPDALTNSGVIAGELGDHKTALAMIQAAIRINPINPFYFNNLGNVLRTRGELEAAAVAFKKSIQLKPDLVVLHNNLGNVMKDLGKLGEAIACFEQALEFDPDFAEAHYNLSLTLLQAGHYERGWEEYEWRFKKDTWQTIYPHRYSKPLWDGRPFQGKTLLVHNEQGFGDIFQFIRYLPMVKTLGGTVIFETRKEMKSLMKDFPGVDILRQMPSHGRPKEDFDQYVPLLTLPGIFRTRLDSIPAKVPYIYADKSTSAYWKKKIPETGFKVGIVWAGKPMHQGVRKRACALSDFSGLSRIPNIRFIGLQKGTASKQAAALSDQMSVLNLGESFQNFADTAAAIDNLDLIITVDTSVAHLAGAMGKPVWTLLSQSPDWRWMLNREDNPWYPSMRLYRQQKPGKWREVFDKIEKDLRDFEIGYSSSFSFNTATPGKKQQPDETSGIQDLINSALNHHQTGELKKAQGLYEKILKQNPLHTDALHLLGCIFFQEGDLDAAEKYIQKAMSTNPDNPLYHNSLGLVYRGLNRHNEAADCYEKALALAPDLVEAHNNLGIVYHEQGKADSAVSCFQNALKCNNHSPEVHNNLGNALRDQGKLDEAISGYERALELNPEYVEACNNMGVAFHSKNNFDVAVSYYQKALRINPDNTNSHINMGITCQAMGKYSNALEFFQKALEIEPENPDAHFHYSFVLLLLEDFETGWKEYEWRQKKDDWQHVHAFYPSLRRWDGSSFKGKTLLVHAEQGLGDTLQFVRYLPMVKELGGKVIFETNKPLFNLFRNMEGIDELVPLSSTGRSSLDYDYDIPLMSLPGLFKTTLENIPFGRSYIDATQEKTDYWKQRVSGTGFNIGLVWAGKPAAHDNRPCRLKHFLPLFEIPGIRLFGLQKGTASNQILELPQGLSFTNYGEEFEDFADTAGFLENLDMILTIDTSVAHLAGAMGKPVWTLVPYSPDWRWLLKKEDSPWYPTMRLFRQPKPGAWAPVIQKISDELKTYINHGPHEGPSIEHQP